MCAPFLKPSTHQFSHAQFFIINTNPHNKPGKHWVALYFPKRGQAEFVDSYGHPPSKAHRNFTTFLRQHAKGYMYNKQRLQGTGSQTCGALSIYYIMHRVHAIPVYSITSKFTDNLSQNDKHITEWIQKINIM